MSPITTEDKLKERIKELSCLYEVTTVILQHESSVELTLTKLSHAVKKAYQYSDHAIVELFLEAHYLNTGSFTGETVCQTSRITVFDEEMGYIKVHYDAGQYTRAHFLDEEQKLLDKVALEVSSFFEKIIMTEKEKLFQRNIAHTDRLTVLGEITAGIAHELNTPLGNILGFAELICEGSKDKQLTKDISKIIKAAIHSREIVKKLMFFSCEMPQHPERINLVEAISQALALLEPNFSKKDIKYRFEHSSKILTVGFDPIQLTQALFNIVLNAIYASPEGSEVSVRLYEDIYNIFITISDQGQGIPADIKRKIFEPFFTTKPLGEGTGLGLSVVHGIIKSHGGKIVAEDNDPVGTVFKIRLTKNTA